MKFNVGDPVLAIDNIGHVREWTTGIVSELPSHLFGNYRVRFADGDDLYVKDSNSIKPLYGDGGKKVVITTEGKTTLARLYEGGKVVRSAEAKCSPSDTFSFQTGAELAFKRLFETAKPGPTNKYEAMSDEELKDAACGRAYLCISVNGERFHECPLFSKSAFGSCTRYLRDHPELRPVLIQYCLDEDAAQEKQAPPKVDKPREEPKFSWEEFKAGKIAVHCDTEEKAKEFVAEAREKFPDKFVNWEKGETNWSVYKEETRYGISDLFCYGTWCYDGYTIIDYPFSPAPEPKTEPVKLYCVKDLGDWLTNGKVYESVNGHVVVDDGCEHVDIIMRTRGYLYPLVKRPAIAGEWVYINNAAWNASLYKNGDVFQAENTFLDGDFINQKEGGVFGAEYLVIDGYHPEEKKPEFYNGKVVCVAKGYENSVPIGCFVTGKIYLVQDGRVTSEDGCTSDQYISIERLSRGMGWTFIEYKGEA